MNMQQFERPFVFSISNACEAIGYGRVMQIAAQFWKLKDPIGALTVGPALGTIEKEGTHHDLSEKVRELQAENAELRATLAAEQGKPEGAPSKKWMFSQMDNQWETLDGWAVSNGDTWDGWILSREGYDGEEEFETARAAMAHADKVDGGR